jgi:hypothetical protein
MMDRMAFIKEDSGESVNDSMLIRTKEFLTNSSFQKNGISDGSLMFGDNNRKSSGEETYPRLLSPRIILQKK